MYVSSLLLFRFFCQSRMIDKEICEFRFVLCVYVQIERYTKKNHNSRCLIACSYCWCCCHLCFSLLISFAFCLHVLKTKSCKNFYKNYINEKMMKLLKISIFFIKYKIRDPDVGFRSCRLCERLLLGLLVLQASMVA